MLLHDQKSTTELGLLKLKDLHGRVITITITETPIDLDWGEQHKEWLKYAAILEHASAELLGKLWMSRRTAQHKGQRHTIRTQIWEELDQALPRMPQPTRG